MTTQRQQIDINQMMNLMITFMIVVMMMKMMTAAMKGIGEKPKPKRLYPGGPRVGEFYRAPEIPAEEITLAEALPSEKEAKRIALEGKAQALITQSGKPIEYVGLQPGWEELYATPIYRFRHIPTGQEFIARDLEDLRWKVDVIEGASHHSGPLTGKPLSEREVEVLKLRADGYSYWDIAAELNISGNTVRSHLKNIYKKLDAKTGAQAVAKAIRQGIINNPHSSIGPSAPTDAEIDLISAEVMEDAII